MTWVSSEKPYNGNYGTPPANTSPNKEDGYYFTADSADALERIFQEIAEETGQTIENVVTKLHRSKVRHRGRKWEQTPSRQHHHRGRR